MLDEYIYGDHPDTRCLPSQTERIPTSVWASLHGFLLTRAFFSHRLAISFTLCKVWPPEFQIPDKREIYLRVKIDDSPFHLFAAGTMLIFLLK